MAKRLTSFSKLIIVLLVVGAAFFGFQYLQDNGYLGGESSNKEQANDDSKKEGPKRDGDVIKIGVVTWGGYAGGQYFNEGFAASEESRFFKDYGIKVEFIVNDDPEASLNAWKAGDIDLHWYTIDAFPTIIGGLKDFNPVVLWQADWSRGGDAIVTRRGIRNVADLKGKKIAVAEMTPSHSFLLYLLEAAGMSVDDIEIIPQASAIDAAAAFKSKQVDAAVVWSPDDQDCLRAVPGSVVLESSKNASHIIADFFFAKRKFVENNKASLAKLYQGWMIGAAEINSNAQSKQKAASILAKGLGIPEADALAAINNVRLTNHGDNMNFFGLDPAFGGVTGNSLYLKMANTYKNLGFANDVPGWRQIAYPSFVQEGQNVLTGSNQAPERGKRFTKLNDNDGKTKEAIATKRVSISFRSGEFKLDENAKYIIDNEFVDIAKSFGNSRIRIEGNTDNVGKKSNNIALSKRRATAVASYLMEEHGMPGNRFVIVGNGPDKPVASNKTSDGKSKNRRTDFELIKD